MNALYGAAAVRKLTRDYGLPVPYAERAVRVAAEHGLNTTNSGDMRRTVTITKLHNSPSPGRMQFTVTPGMPAVKPDKISKIPAEGSASRADVRYTSGVQERRSLAGRSRGRSDHSINRKKATAMAPRSTKQAEPEAEVEANGERDLTYFAEKDLTPTMMDFMEWIVDVIFEGDEDAFQNCGSERAAYIGITTYHHFQRSDFNIERREARRAERAEARAAKAASKASDEEEAPAPRRGRGKGKAAPAAETPKPTPPKRGRPAGKAAAPAGTAPRRGRPRKAAAEAEEAAAF